MRIDRMDGSVCRLKIRTIACQIRRDVCSDRSAPNKARSQGTWVRSSAVCLLQGRRWEGWVPARSLGQLPRGKDPPAQTQPNCSI